MSLGIWILQEGYDLWYVEAPTSANNMAVQNENTIKGNLNDKNGLGYGNCWDKLAYPQMLKNYENTPASTCTIVCNKIRSKVNE